MTGPQYLIDILKRRFKPVNTVCHSLKASPSAHTDRTAAAKEYQQRNAPNEHEIGIEAGLKMGKSNKFDYTKKKNTGINLAQFIAKQLDSEAEAVKKAAERQVRKHSVCSIDSSDGADTDWSIVHHIDLRIPSKELGDRGVFTLADGLETALIKGTAEASLALECLDLTDNGLTTTSLARLASVIESASLDLKMINLANNNISVVSDAESAHWESFLRSFRDCQKLRRLDISGNVGLGARAMEDFGRVHIGEPQVDPIRLTRDLSVYSLHSAHTHEDGARADSFALEPTADADLTRKSISHGRTLTRRCGLRSIPYLALNDIALTDTGALWLSYVLEDHYFPEQLMSELNATVATNPVEAYRQDKQVRGIDWTSNEPTLGKDALLLLNKAESVRRQTVVDDLSTLAGSIEMDDSAGLGDDLNYTTERVAERKNSRASAGHRRTSMRSTTTEDSGEQSVSELDSLRKRIQRQIIAHDRPKSVHLWIAALTLLRCARSLMVASQQMSRRCYTGEALFKLPAAPDDLTTPIQQPSTPVRKLANGHSKKKLSNDTGKAATAARASYAKLLSASSGKSQSDCEQAITEVNTPKKVFKAHRKDAFSDAADPVAVSERLSGLVLNGARLFERFVEYQQRRIERAELGSKAFRDTEVTCHLSRELMDYIFAFMLPERQMELMTEEQRAAVVSWGLSRETLKVAETSWWGKDMTNQAWWLLDSIKCLEYSQ